MREHLTGVLAEIRDCMFAAGPNTALRGVLDECLEAHGYLPSGREISVGSGSSATTDGWDFYLSRASEPGPGPERRYLDAADETLISELVEEWYASESGRPSGDLASIKIMAGGRLYLAYAALSYYTGIPVGEMKTALLEQRVRRPMGDAEQIWEAYTYPRRSQYLLVESHRIIVPGIEVPRPEVCAPRSAQ